MRIAVIGCGTVAERWHLPASIALLGKDNVFAVDADPSRRDFVKEFFGVRRVYSEIGQIRDSVDAVVIATPPHLHLRVGDQAFQMGFHVLCEKPLANKSSECIDLIRASESTLKTLAVCHTYRFFPNRIRLREAIQRHELGPVLWVSVEHGSPANWPALSGYSYQKELVPGGVFLIEGLHSLDFLLWCFGIPCVFEYFDDSIGGIESNSLFRCEFEDGCHAWFRNSRTCSLGNKIRVAGSEGMAEIDLFDMVSIKWLTKHGERLERCGSFGNSFGAVARRQMEDFLDAVQSGGAPMAGGHDGLSVIRVIENCYEVKSKRSRPDHLPLPGLVW